MSSSTTDVGSGVRRGAGEIGGQLVSRAGIISVSRCTEYLTGFEASFWQKLISRNTRKFLFALYVPQYADLIRIDSRIGVRRD